MHVIPRKTTIESIESHFNALTLISVRVYYYFYAKRNDINTYFVLFKRTKRRTITRSKKIYI